ACDRQLLSELHQRSFFDLPGALLADSQFAADLLERRCRPGWRESEMPFDDDALAGLKLIETGRQNLAKVLRIPIDRLCWGFVGDREHLVSSGLVAMLPAHLFWNRSGEVSQDCPRRVGAELKSSRDLELVNRTHQCKVSVADQLKQLGPAAAPQMTFRNTDDQSQVRLDQRTLNLRRLR